ncbi:hypothetical protein H1Z61_05335 [Bacillus aquiflavi]|uniref:LysR substrate-binding domain-containing protein n=1 Tax=Bacillus aquiflavi TaxID=2672567 RepID=A0A6B3W038_9BACI|nr:hypothetical protein [Bacillus aquiflavi]NEY80954.1 hypothetical protein [Bacillus aquiflavi]UAC49668.1 hypothetical protein K6959_07665 [Bacillus aquiflavi]
MEPAASFRFPIVLQLFTEKYPTVRIRVLMHQVNKLHEMLQNGEIDLAICTELLKVSIHLFLNHYLMKKLFYICQSIIL